MDYQLCENQTCRFNEDSFNWNKIEVSNDALRILAKDFELLILFL
jgi:hypothetical protein